MIGKAVVSIAQSLKVLRKPCTVTSGCMSHSNASMKSSESGSSGSTPGSTSSLMRAAIPENLHGTITQRHTMRLFVLHAWPRNAPLLGIQIKFAEWGPSHFFVRNAVRMASSRARALTPSITRKRARNAGISFYGIAG